MNVFLREMKAHRWGLLFWSLGMIMMIYSGMAKYGAYEAAGESVTAILEQMPDTVQVVFGMTGFDLGTAAGFYGMLFLYLAVMGAVHASLLGAHLIAKEERDHTSEFLYAKPASRSRVLTGKLLAGLVNIVVLNLVTAASSFYFVDLFNRDEPFGGDIALLMVGLFFLQLIFFAIGAAVAGISRKPKSAASRATSIMFGTFLLFYVVNLNKDLGVLKYFTPFKYFEAGVLMADGALDPVFVGLSVVIVALAIAGTYRAYSARDLAI
ncbi:MAG: ABC transporter permease subunit [Coriobacteriia bacterium]|nr:ABC transporter permease subunit [Coriobacteriia bacterium]